MLIQITLPEQMYISCVPHCGDEFELRQSIPYGSYHQSHKAKMGSALPSTYALGSVKAAFYTRWHAGPCRPLAIWTADIVIHHVAILNIAWDIAQMRAACFLYNFVLCNVHALADVQLMRTARRIDSDCPEAGLVALHTHYVYLRSQACPSLV